MGRIPLRDERGRFAGSMSDGHNKSAAQRRAEYFQHSGRTNSPNVSSVTSQSKPAQIVQKIEIKLDVEKIAAILFERLKAYLK